MDLLDNVEVFFPIYILIKLADGNSSVTFSKRINILKCDPLTVAQMSIRLSEQVNGGKNNYRRKETGNRTEMIM